MAQEIERKFLVNGDFKSDAFKATRITQGYLSSVPERTVRVRVKGDKGFLWCRTEALEEISLDAIGREDGSYGLSEETGVVTAVVTYHYRKVLLTWESLEDVVSKALCSHTNDILVHAVGTCAHDTAQTTSTELQVLIECINEG